MPFRTTKKDYSPPEPQAPLQGFVLLNQQVTNPVGLRARLEGTLGLSVDLDAASPQVLEIFAEDIAAFLSIVNTRLENPGLRPAADRNYFWPDAAHEVSEHQAHVMITLLGPPNAPFDRDRALRQMQLLAKVAAVVMGNESAIGFYVPAQEIVHEAAPYRKLALMADRDGVLAAPLVVHLMAAPQSNGGSTGYTRGMHIYGHDDLQVLGSRHTPEEVYEVLANVALFVISNDVTLRPNETLQYGDDLHLPVKLALKAQYFGGRALQLDY